MRNSRHQIATMVSLALIVGCSTVSLPPHDEKSASLVQNLSWDSVGGNCVGAALVVDPAGEAATDLLRIGKAAAPSLLTALRDEKRGVAAHLILTKIWEPRNYMLQTHYHYNAGELTGWTYSLNGLNWEWISYEGKQRAGLRELDECASKWERRFSESRIATAH